MWIDKTSAQKRYDICKSCDRFIPITAQCKECGCFMKIKCKLQDAQCPLKKWPTFVEVNTNYGNTDKHNY